MCRSVLIPVSTVWAWEQGATAPDAAGKAYIRAMGGDMEGVARALRRQPHGWRIERSLSTRNPSKNALTAGGQA